MEYEVKEVSVEEILPIRSTELREGRDLEECRFDEDDDENAVHLGLFHNEEIIGCVSIFQTLSEKFDEPNQHRYRGMAVSKAYQGMALGNLILNKADSIVRNRKAEFIWMSAREKAISFYRRNGYNVVGSAFDIPTVGQHYLMYKQL